MLEWGSFLHALYFYAIVFWTLLAYAFDTFPGEKGSLSWLECLVEAAGQLEASSFLSPSLGSQLPMWFALPWNKFLETLWLSNCLSMAQYSAILGSLVLTATTISFISNNANIMSICLSVFQFSISSNLRMWGKRTVI